MCNTAKSAEWIIMKLYIGSFTNIFQHVVITGRIKKIMNSLQNYLYAFL